MLNLTGKTALITGGTSGIGAETAQVLARAGANVLIAGRNEAAAAEIVNRITTTGGTAVYVLGDISDPAFASHAVAECVTHFHALNVLANVAGTICRGDVETTSDANWRRLMQINVDGTFYMCRAAIAEMRKAGGGSIINLGSTAGLVGMKGLAAYCASKAAVVNLTRSMALDYAAEHIRVNSVNPGAVDTPMLVSGYTAANPDEVREVNRASIPQGWLPDPVEVANIIAFLASDLSRHITGATLSVDGGYTAA